MKRMSEWTKWELRGGVNGDGGKQRNDDDDDQVKWEKERTIETENSVGENT